MQVVQAFVFFINYLIFFFFPFQGLRFGGRALGGLQCHFCVVSFVNLSVNVATEPLSLSHCICLPIVNENESFCRNDLLVA